jgi:GTP-binding protein LepA
LVVDASQGIEAQTLANAYLAIEGDLELVPVLNKIDLPAADPDLHARALADLIGDDPEHVLRISAKTGEGVKEVLEAIVTRMPPPAGDPVAPLRALVFDSVYDQYRGVVAFVRVMDGELKTGQQVRAMATGSDFSAEEVGVMSPAQTPVGHLVAGESGYIVTGLKSLVDLRVGDTLTLAGSPASEALPGYREAKPMVFCGLFPVDADDYPDLRDALEKLSLNDASLVWEPETSQALGFGFRCGFLGLLHMDIIRERLEREYDLDLITTTPNVEYEVTTTSGARPSTCRAPTTSRSSRSPTCGAPCWCRRTSWGP